MQSATIAGLLTLAACAGPGTAVTVTTDTLPGGAVRVMNSGPSEWQDTSGWKLSLERTVHPAGIEDDWARVRSIMLRPSGDLYIVDGGAPAIYRYGPDGALIGSLARAGDGPGEIRQPTAAFVGDTLVINDTQQWRVTLLTADGEFIRSFAGPCCHAGPPIAPTNTGSFWVIASGQGAESMTSQWIRMSTGGARLDSLVIPEAVPARIWTVSLGGGTARYSVPLAPQSVAVFLPGGGLRYGGTDRNLFLTTTDGRDTTLIFGRSDLTATPAPASLRDSLFARSMRNEALRQVADKADIPEQLPMWLLLHLDDDGNTWVERGGWEQPHSFDVYRPDGVLRGTVPAPFAFGRMAWSGDRVAVLVTDDDGRSVVQIYRIAR